MQHSTPFVTMGGVHGKPPSAPTLEHSFEAYRRDGDLDALGRVFDTTAQRLVLLAERMVGDPHLAEDVLQRTFVRAIEKRASWDRQRRLLPWLTGILTHEARAVRRAARQLPDRERLGVRAAAGAPEEALCRRESADQVLAAIEALGPTYREVLVLHLVHGLQAGQIATALDMPGGTVRSRIARGLARLRQSLPVTVAAAWLPVSAMPTGGAAFETVREAVVAAGARTVPPTRAVPATLATGFCGAILMSKIQISVVAVVAGALGLLVVGGIVLFAPGGDMTRSENVVREPARAAVGNPLADAGPNTRHQLGSRVVERPGTCMVTGTIHDPDGRPLPEAQLRIVVRGGDPADPVVVDEWRNIQIDSEGRFEVSVARIFEAPAVERLTARLWAVASAEGHGGWRRDAPRGREPWLPGNDSTHHFDITLRPYAGSISGRIVRPDGTPVSGARLLVDGPDDVWARPSGADGHFVFHAEDDGTYRVAATSPALGTTAAWRTVRVDAPTDHDVGYLVLRPTAVVEARLRMKDGSPANDIEVRLAARGSTEDGSPAPSHVSAMTDEEGRFRVANLVPSAGGYTLTVPYLHRKGDVEPQRFILDPARGPANVVLDGQHLTITATAAHGRVLGTKLSTTIWLPPYAPPPDVLRRIHGGEVEVPDHGESDYRGIGGRLCVIVAAGCSMTIANRAPGCLFDSTWHHATRGVARAEIDLELRVKTPDIGGRVRFDLRDERGEPVHDFSVRVLHPTAGVVVETIESSQLARGELSGPLPPGRLRFVVMAGPRVGWDRSDRTIVVEATVLEGEVTDVPVQVVRRGVIRLDITRFSADTTVRSVGIRGSATDGEIDWDIVRRHKNGGWTGLSSVFFDTNAEGPVIAYGRVAPGTVSATVAVPGQRIREIRAEVRPHQVTTVPVVLGDPRRRR